MKSSAKPLLSEEEQALLNEVSLRPIEPDERDRFDELICREHYLHRADLVGEQVRYVAEVDGQWASVLPTTEWLEPSLISCEVRRTAGHGLDFASDSGLTPGGSTRARGRAGAALGL